MLFILIKSHIIMHFYSHILEIVFDVLYFSIVLHKFYLNITNLDSKSWQMLHVTDPLWKC